MTNPATTRISIDAGSASWFTVDKLENDGALTFLIEEPHHDEEVKSHLILGSERALLIDSGMGVLPIRPIVEQLTDLPITLVNSHAHWDHRGDNASFDDIWIHEAEAADLERPVLNEKLRPWFAPEYLSAPLPSGVTPESIAITPSRATRMLHGGELIELGNRTLEVIHAPGHSPGGLVFLDRANRLLFTTDVAYAAHLYVMAMTDLPVYIETLSRLSELVPAVDVLLPSHGRHFVSPSVLPEMRDALIAIRDGLEPQSKDGERSTWEFGEFGVYAWD